MDQRRLIFQRRLSVAEPIARILKIISSPDKPYLFTTSEIKGVRESLKMISQKSSLIKKARIERKVLSTALTKKP